MTNKTKKTIVITSIGLLCIILILFVVTRIAVTINNQALDRALGINSYTNDSIKNESIDDINLAMKLCPRNPVFYQNKIQILIDLKKYREAIRTIDELLKFQPKNINNLLIQGFIYDYLGSSDSASLKYSEAYQLFIKIEDSTYIKDNSRQDYELAKIILYVLNNKPISKSDIAKLMKKYPDNNSFNYWDTLINNFDRNKFAREQILGEETIIFKN